MIEIGTEALAGRFRPIVTGLGQVMASREMGGMVSAVGNLAAKGRLQLTVNAIAAALAASSNKTRAMMELVGQSWQQNVNLNAFDRQRLTMVERAMESIGYEIMNLISAGTFQAIEEAARAVDRSNEAKEFVQAFSALSETSRNISRTKPDGAITLADLNNQTMLKAINDVVVAGGKLIRSPSMRNLFPPVGNLLSSGKLRRVVAVAGAVLANQLANAMPDNATAMFLPVIDTVVKVVGDAINQGLVDGPVQAMRAIATTREFGAMTTAWQAMAKLRASTDLVATMRRMRTSENFVQTNQLMRYMAGVR